jgi:hypothetical protein
VNARDENCVSALGIAVYAGYEGIVRLLVQKGARINVERLYGMRCNLRRPKAI